MKVSEEKCFHRIEVCYGKMAGKSEFIIPNPERKLLFFTFLSHKMNYWSLVLHKVDFWSPDHKSFGHSFHILWVLLFLCFTLFCDFSRSLQLYVLTPEILEIIMAGAFFSFFQVMCIVCVLEQYLITTVFQVLLKRQCF